MTINCLLSGVASFALLTAALGAEPQQWTLARQWEVQLGPTADAVDQTKRPFYRAAVCANGHLYLSDGISRAVALGPDGSVLADEAGLIQVSSALAVACDEDGNFVIAVRGKVASLAVDSGKFRPVSSVELSEGLKPFGISPLPGGGWFILGFVRPGAEHIHVVSSQGVLLASYGARPGNVDSKQWPRFALNGSIAWNGRAQQLLYIPENPYEFQTYTRDHGLVASKPRGDAEFRPPAPSGSLGFTPGDRVVRSAFLPNGSLVVQVVKRAVVGDVLRSTTYLEVLDPEMNPEGPRVSVDDVGHLQGASQDGSLYFSLITRPKGIRVIKGRLLAP